VVFASDDGISKAFRNLAGVEVASVERLNLLQLAPGGHLGRFVVWTKGAFEALDRVYGTTTTASEQKKGYKLPRPIMANADVARLINSDEVQSVVRPPKEAAIKSRPLKKNPLKNLGALVKLNPHAIVTRRNAVLAADRRGKARAEKLAKLRAGEPSGAPKRSKDAAAVGKAFYKQLVCMPGGGLACGRARAGANAVQYAALFFALMTRGELDGLSPAHNHSNNCGLCRAPPRSYISNLRTGKQLAALTVPLAYSHPPPPPPPLFPRSWTRSTRGRTTRCSPSGWASASRRKQAQGGVAARAARV
jgi:hypothetical protein